MPLSDEQQRAVADWVRSGSSLSDIQRRIASDFAITMTYMDVRFLVLELGVALKDKVTKPVVAPAAVAAAPAEAGPGDALDDDPDAPAGELGAPSQVSVELDRITKPGSIVSGTVRFSDGVSASWSLDQLGRLALSAGKPGYQPSPADVQAFQLELRQVLERRGF